MQITKPEQKEFKKELLEDGSYAARIFQVVDLGSQKSSYKGQESLKRKIEIAFEIPSKTISYTDKEGQEVTKPFALYKRYTLSIGDKALLTPIVKATGLDTTSGLETSDLIGRTLLISVGNDVYNDNPYNTIETATALPEGMSVPDPVNDVVVFDLESFDSSVFDSLPEWTKEKIAESPEYKEVAGGGLTDEDLAEVSADEINF